MPGAGLVCAGLALHLGVALAGCDRVTPAPLGAPGYPSLHDVPPRPEPVGTVRQREELAAGLIRDRADARYTNQAIRYRTGLADAPPLPMVVTPEPPPVAVTPQAIPVRPARPEALDDDDSLGNFLRRLVERAETVAPFEAPAVFPDEPLAPSPAEPAGEPEPLGIGPPEPAAGPEAAAEPLSPLALFPARTEAEEDPGAGFLTWVGRKLRALAGSPGPAAARPLHPALVPVAVTGPEDLRRARPTAREPRATSPMATPPAPAVPAPKPAVAPPAPPVPALKPAAATGAGGAATRRTAGRDPAAPTVVGSA